MKIKNILCFFILCFVLFFNSKGAPPKSKSPNGTRINFGSAAGFYMINTRHAKSGSQNPSFTFGIRHERKVDRAYKTYLAFGVEYFMHGLNYYSYLFKPDTLKIYDKSQMNYKYSLFVHELALPLQLKILFRRADNSLFSPYISLGYHLRYLLTSNLNIYKSGELVKKDSPEILFRNPFLSKKLGSFVSAAIGWQKNNLTNSKNSFFIELNYKYGFSQYYFNRDYAATSMYINGTHLSLLLGLKF